jgi:hypothetical protein
MMSDGEIKRYSVRADYSGTEEIVVSAMSEDEAKEIAEGDLSFCRVHTIDYTVKLIKESK